MLGEHDTRKKSDCTEDLTRPCTPTRIVRNIAEVIKHENYTGGSAPQNDIALIRLDKPVPLFTEDPSKSSISPICLPWSNR